MVVIPRSVAQRESTLFSWAFLFYFAKLYDMKNLIKTDFDEAYDRLNEYIPADFTFAGLNTKNYIEYLNDCIDKNGERYFKNKRLLGIHTHHI